mgnify:CR=1 FL=1
MERKEIDKTRPVTYYLSLTDEQLNFLSSNEGGINRIQCFRRLLHHTATADTTYTKRGISKPLMQGQTCVSALELSKEWNCNRKTVIRFLKQLEQLDMRCIAAWKHEGETVYTVNALYKRDNGKAKSEQNPNKSVSDPTSSTLPLPSSDSSEITPSEMEQIHSLEEIPDDVREQLLAEDMEQFHEQREM